ncbi:hypothetical protein DU508_18585 [Pedobacter chinensis]|uniref:Alginate export domain-containing protein n=1 Tax=Pedobacter chinensis TaxID=2282421 RepID=A0A369PYJ3_9SPHI|nr:alginate export family protein [Pedobacter chinensis]RDC55158.1 hypothetical protein DU508_18585 [Pedobacter chinensis]
MKKLSLILIGLVIALPVFAQLKPVFKPLRSEDDFSYLKNDSLKNWYRTIKFIPLNSKKDFYATIGGEIRTQYFNVQNESWGDQQVDDDNYLLNRSLLHFDLHYRKNIRLFLQLQSSLAFSRIDASPVDNNPLDLHQAFIDMNLIRNKENKLMLSVGRQEMQYGSQRLVSLRERPNNRQAFDGIKITFAKKSLNNSSFFTLPVANKPNSFDDNINRNVKFWGNYTVLHNLRFLNNLDLYYLGIWKKNFKFGNFTQRELRHSTGIRVWKETGNWQYDFEAVYQFGKFGTSDISAYTLSSNSSYTFTGLKAKPKIGLKAEVISGDNDPKDHKLQTFNALYPKGAYFGLAALIGPSNLMDLHPYLEVKLNQKIVLAVDYDLFWRYSENDGIYATNLHTLYKGQTMDGRFIGQQLAADLSYRLSPYLSITTEATWFIAGTYLENVSKGKNILLTGATIQLKF